MAFQSSVLRDGEWVTETVDIQTALRTSETSKPPVESYTLPPPCGLLSRTLVESPIVHWILPARLRSKNHNDIAFVGDNFVQINELRKDGQAHEIARWNSFESRIRGAVVLGDSLPHGLDYDDTANIVKTEDQDVVMQEAPRRSDNSSSPRSLPPQMIVLMLEGGEAVYLFLREKDDSSLEFVLNRHHAPLNLSYLGYHLSVDPSSRYMAAASPDGVLVIYEFEPLQSMEEQYHSRGSFDPIKSVRVRAVQGLIHKLDFLYPRPGDDYHVILLLIMVKKERNHSEPISRMVTYEWEVGDSLQAVFEEEKLGNRLPKEHRMPSLLIPLRFDTAFFTVSQPDIGIVKNCLSGSPVFEVLETDTPGTTSLHHGIGKPLWTAWSRPFRLKKYFEKTDIIYLAREDGAIIHVEIDAPTLVPSVTNVGCLNSNVNTAFTTAYDVFSDVLINGGDSGPGGIWKLAPRTDLAQVSVLPNWSPVIDIATVSQRLRQRSSSDQIGTSGGRASAAGPLQKPDNLFTASGRGYKGNLTQWRWGIQGRIGLDVESGETIKRSWGFALEGPDGNALYGLLALPSTSIALRFAMDFSQVDSVHAEATGLDLMSRTLHACQMQDGLVIQVTERSVSLITGYQSWRYMLDDILGMTGVIADNAFCRNEFMVISSHHNAQPQLHTLRRTATEVKLIQTWPVDGEVTCVSLLGISGSRFVVAGSVKEGVSHISVHSLEGKLIEDEALIGRPAQSSDGLSSFEAHSFEPLTSLCVVREDAHHSYCIAGTRCGHLLYIQVTGKSRDDPMVWKSEAMGVAPVDVFPTNEQYEHGADALACCDGNLIMMSRFSEPKLTFNTKASVWLTDSNDGSMPSPPVHSAFSLGFSLSESLGHMSLMLLSESRLLVADLWPRHGLVPRTIPLGGSPTRVIFSETWNCLVVALYQDDKPNISFIDPDTGMRVATASDKDKKPSEFISGLGHRGDRIYGLSEWLYVKDGKTFAFLLVSTKDGRLLVVSVTKMDPRQSGSNGKRLQYRTRYKKSFNQPIFSIVGDDDGIMFCVDKTLHWDVLDLAEKKLKEVKRHNLDSPATSLRVVDGKIHALTTLHSLEVLDHRAGVGEEMALIHTDRVSRVTIHMADINADAQDPNDGRWPLTLLSCQGGGISGVWVPRRQRSRELETVFEGSLPHSIRRFAHAQIRPPWQCSRPRGRYGSLTSIDGDSEVFGVSLNGSLRHFQLIDLNLWRLLSFLQNLSKKSPDLKRFGDMFSDLDSIDRENETDVEPRLHPKSMLIDGDLLSRCVQTQHLEKMVRTADGLDLFRRYLDGLDGGEWTKTFKNSSIQSEEERRAAYFELCYAVLEHVLAPAL